MLIFPSTGISLSGLVLQLLFGIKSLFCIIAGRFGLIFPSTGPSLCSLVLQLLFGIGAFLYTLGARAMLPQAIFRGSDVGVSLFLSSVVAHLLRNIEVPPRIPDGRLILAHALIRKPKVAIGAALASLVVQLLLHIEVFLVVLDSSFVLPQAFVGQSDSIVCPALYSLFMARVSGQGQHTLKAVQRCAVLFHMPLGVSSDVQRYCLEVAVLRSLRHLEELEALLFREPVLLRLVKLPCVSMQCYWVGVGERRLIRCTAMDRCSCTADGDGISRVFESPILSIEREIDRWVHVKSSRAGGDHDARIHRLTTGKQVNRTFNCFKERRLMTKSTVTSYAIHNPSIVPRLGWAAQVHICHRLQPSAYQLRLDARLAARLAAATGTTRCFPCL